MEGPTNETVEGTLEGTCDKINRLVASIGSSAACVNQAPRTTGESADEISITCSSCDTPFLSRHHHRRRCESCQVLYNQKHVSECPDCGDTYYAYLSDGRVFDKCYRCYLSTVRTCQKCGRKAYNGYSLCKTCYEESRDRETFEFRPVVKRLKHVFVEEEEEGGAPLARCESKECVNLTRRRLCVSCLERHKIIVLE